MDRIELVFPDPEAVSARDLSSYLHHFSAAYTIAVDRYGQVPLDTLLERFSYYLDDFRRTLCALGNDEKLDMVEYYFHLHMRRDELIVDRLVTSDHLRLGCQGSEVGVTLSAMISGCTLSENSDQLDMLPMLQGLKNLKQAFFKLPGRDK